MIQPSNKLSALDMLNGEMFSGSMPGFLGGDAAPAVSSADSRTGGINFGSSFTVAGNGGNASSSQPQNTNLLLIGAIVLAIIVIGRKK